MLKKRTKYLHCPKKVCVSSNIYICRSVNVTSSSHTSIIVATWRIRLLRVFLSLVSGKSPGSLPARHNETRHGGRGEASHVVRYTCPSVPWRVMAWRLRNSLLCNHKCRLCRYIQTRHTKLLFVLNFGGDWKLNQWLNQSNYHYCRLKWMMRTIY